MTSSRQPAVAGQFYPADAKELKSMLRQLLDHARLHPHNIRLPKILVVPHAGYIYSGPVAAEAYCSLEAEDAGRIRKVVLFGPAHRYPLQGMAVPSVDAFSTPLGDIAIDRELRNELMQADHVSINDAAHAEEHSLEVQLPFLQSVLNNITILPVLVGDTGLDSVSSAMEHIWHAEDTLFLISTDLSHYLDYDSGRKKDLQTALAIEEMNFNAINSSEACGRLPLQAVLKTASQHAMRIHRLALASSGDTYGGKQKVVGYGAWAITENA